MLLRSMGMCLLVLLTPLAVAAQEKAKTAEPKTTEQLAQEVQESADEAEGDLRESDETGRHR